MNNTVELWELEPDHATWIDQATGLHCLMRKHKHLSVLCGYVRVMKGHPLYGKYSKAERTLSVHGGVTFARAPRHYLMKRGFWIGFDCGHSGDLIPGVLMALKSIGRSHYYDSGYPEEYRDGDYVRAQCSKLAYQLSIMKAKK